MVINSVPPVWFLLTEQCSGLVLDHGMGINSLASKWSCSSYPSLECNCCKVHCRSLLNNSDKLDFMFHDFMIPSHKTVNS